VFASLRGLCHSSPWATFVHTGAQRKQRVRSQLVLLGSLPLIWGGGDVDMFANNKSGIAEMETDGQRPKLAQKGTPPAAESATKPLR
jgi:hypothetical protein